ncbi:MAG: DNA mismatch repair protein MutS, partial [Desulfobacterales bacterium]|nr:DNA mismatch repair protein MutS [Desulfobacterales bacterium]
ELFKNLKTGSKQGTLISSIDKTITSMGSRLIISWLKYPLLNIKKINERLDAVYEGIKKQNLRNNIRESLKSIQDLERINSKISMKHANARDLLALKTSLLKLPEIFGYLSQFESNFYNLTIDLESLNNIAILIESAIREDAPMTINEGNIIKNEYDKDLDELIQISRDGKGWLANLETIEKEKTKINSLKVRYNKVFGYYIEIPKAKSENVPPNYIRKQTLANAERFITEELKSFEDKIINSEEKRNSLEYHLFNELREKINIFTNTIYEAAKFLSQIDVILSLAEVASQNNFCRPNITTDGIIYIEDGRHPVIEQILTGERFVPNTIKLDDIENQILIITGPNMAGKSTVLRQVAAIVLMAQIGSFIPASKASITIIDRIFTRVGALDNLSQGQSTFMVEMQETANILNNASSKSLIIMDEIGRGTSTFDGLSIAWAVAEYLHDLHGTGIKTLFATHYHELTELSKLKPKCKNLNILVKEVNDRIIFLRKLVEGSTNRSYGIQVARLAGVPEPVIERAKNILEKIESNNQAVDYNIKKKESPYKHKQRGLFERIKENQGVSSEI